VRDLPDLRVINDDKVQILRNHFSVNGRVSPQQLEAFQHSNWYRSGLAERSTGMNAVDRAIASGELHLMQRLLDSYADPIDGSLDLELLCDFLARNLLPEPFVRSRKPATRGSIVRHSLSRAGAIIF